MERILVVEDDIAIRDLIEINLEIVGYTVITTSDGISAKKLIEEENIDLVLLDVMIPRMDGFTLITKLQNKNIPIIFVTAKESVLDRVKGLRLGAVDYIVKPFETIELLARIEVALRKYSIAKPIKFKHLEILPEQRIVKIEDKVIDLTLKEYDLLIIFLKNKNIALSRDQILEKVWGYDYIGETRTIDIHVQRLRDKLNIKNYIKTIFKIGYRLED